MLEVLKSRYLLISGKPYEMGFQHGTAFKPQIKALIDKLYDLMRQYFPTISGRSQFLDCSKKFVPYAEESAPHLMEEMRGIAEGSEVKFEEIFALNSIVEMAYSAGEFLKLYGCTAFAVTEEGTANNSPIMGQTQDWWVPFSEHFVLLRMKPSHGPEIMMTTLTGMVGLVGRNSEGVYLIANGMTSTDNQYGLPTFMLMRRVLEQKRIGDAIDILLNTRRAGSVNMMIGDKHGEVYDFELTAKDQEIIYPEEGFLVHTNHYLSPRLKDKDVGIKDLPDTVVRLSRMRKFIKKKYGQIDFNYMVGALSDHVGGAGQSICRHADLSIPSSKWSEAWNTAGAPMMEPKTGGFYLAWGNPCESKFERFSLES